MTKKSLFYSPLFYETGISVVRMAVGLLLVYHGWEVFDSEKMKVYLDWDSFKKYSSPSFMVYLGKSLELTGGFLLAIGLLTRVACGIIIITMLYITFAVGSGKIWYDDQHPFLFVLLAIVFFVAGPGKWSIDHSIFNPWGSMSSKTPLVEKSNKSTSE
ncbi:MAG TPA: DoxX family protein [Segetibacter sp.]|jgi:uncharacterized membrane protein YphA (DoxX/SURF4 family)